jgi:hypothetical protein
MLFEERIAVRNRRVPTNGRHLKNQSATTRQPPTLKISNRAKK